MIYDRSGIEIKKEAIIDMLIKCRSGVTVYGLNEARILRAIDEAIPTHGFIEILSLKELEDVLEVKFDGAEWLPYFGAVITDAGEEWLSKNKKTTSFTIQINLCNGEVIDMTSFNGTNTIMFTQEGVVEPMTIKTATEALSEYLEEIK